MKRKISIVIPVCNEEKSIHPLFDSIKTVLNKRKISYEVIFVDDGSTDHSYFNLINLEKSNPNVKVISFIRNFGKSAAIAAGFSKVSGNLIMTMDGDLEDDPSEIPKFMEAIKDKDIVVGWRFHRKHSLSKKILSKIYNSLIRLTTGLKIHDSNCGFKIMKRQVVENLYLYGELHRYIPILASWRGFKVGEVKIKHHSRKFGKSKYGFARVFNGFVDLVTVKFLIEYGKRPSHLFGLGGFFLSLVGSIVIITQYFMKFFYGIPISTFPYLFVLAVLSVILGIQFISLGLLAEIIVSSSKRHEYVIKKKN